VNWTDKGVQSAQEFKRRAEGVGVVAKQISGRIELIFWSLGRYSLIGLFEMPSDEAMATLALKVGAAGAVRTECLRAFTVDDMREFIAGLG
jgi:uncharacterized protein with GYD domain